MRTKVAMAVTLMMFCGVAGAQVNKCIDKSGKVVGYGNECPAGSRAEQMQIQKAPPAAAAPQKSLNDRDADFRKRQVERQEGEKKDQQKRAEGDAKREACSNSQAYLKSLQSGQRISRTDPKTGERSYLADNEYAGETAKARASVDANCK